MKRKKTEKNNRTSGLWKFMKKSNIYDNIVPGEHTEQKKIFEEIITSWVVVVQAFNSSTREA